MFKIAAIAAAAAAIATINTAAAQDDAFAALAGVDAAPMTETDLDAVKGKSMPDFTSLTTVGGQLGLHNYNNAFAYNGVNALYNNLQNWRAQTGNYGYVNWGASVQGLVNANAGFNQAANGFLGAVQHGSMIGQTNVNAFTTGAIHGNWHFTNPQFNGFLVAPTTAQFPLQQQGFSPVSASHWSFR
ncbi:MAG: hypothetical protein AAGC56_15325 [Pseudomonadota bacterium]